MTELQDLNHNIKRTKTKIENKIEEIRLHKGALLKLESELHEIKSVDKALVFKLGEVKK